MDISVLKYIIPLFLPKLESVGHAAFINQQNIDKWLEDAQHEGLALWKLRILTIVHWQLRHQGKLVVALI